jgi:hypothetical protein
MTVPRAKGANTMPRTSATLAAAISNAPTGRGANHKPVGGGVGLHGEHDEDRRKHRR